MLPHYRSIAEMDAATERGEMAFVYAPGDYVEPTPADAPHQPGDVVYMVRTACDCFLPAYLINQPLTVVSCLNVHGITDLWDLDVTGPDGKPVEFFLTNEDVVTRKPF